jgi:hypothetical protein
MIRVKIKMVKRCIKIADVDDIYGFGKRISTNKHLSKKSHIDVWRYKGQIYDIAHSYDEDDGWSSIVIACKKVK